MESQGTLDRGPIAAEPEQRSANLLVTLAKNLFALIVVGGFFLGLETGYFSNDRTSRAEWNEMERLKTGGKGTVVYEAVFDRDLFNERSRPEGYWDFYNGASADSAAFADGVLEIKHADPWLGVQFRHLKFEPGRHYRVAIEARAEGQPGAILTRNRLHDLMREEIPLTGGEFKAFTYHYTAPGGSMDQVNVIFMPNEKEEVKGRTIVRRFRIELLGG